MCRRISYKEIVTGSFLVYHVSRASSGNQDLAFGLPGWGASWIPSRYPGSSSREPMPRCSGAVQKEPKTVDHPICYLTIAAIGERAVHTF